MKYSINIESSEISANKIISAIECAEKDSLGLVVSSDQYNSMITDFKQKIDELKKENHLLRLRIPDGR